MPVARIAATSTSCCSSGVRANSAQLVMVKNSAREWPPIVAWVGSWPSLASIVYLPGGGSSWRGKYPIALGDISVKEHTVVFTLSAIDE